MEIDWRDVAKIFQPVSLPSLSPSAAKKEKEQHHVVRAGSTIIAPFCRKVDQTPPDSDDGSVSEEDVSDEAMLQRHQVVLDRMKEKLDRVMAARQQTQRPRGRPPASVKK